MAHNRGGLLAQIEADVAGHSAPLPSLLGVVGDSVIGTAIADGGWVVVHR